MTPYGIVYKDNIYALEQSCLVWQKKYGVLRLSSLLKVAAINAILAVIINVAYYLFTGEDLVFYVYTAIIMIICVIAVVYITAKTNYAKQMARASMSLYQKQAVIFDDRIEFTSPYSKSAYYYDEILHCEEEAGIITIIIDSGALPISIYKACVGKGNYTEFAHLLRSKLGTRYAGKDGM